MPGVSISVAVRNADDGQVTSISSMSSGAIPARSTSIDCSFRVNRACIAPPLRGLSTTWYDWPFRYQVTIRVHSPASVVASRSPTSAFSSVDLPDLTRPAIATRSGSSSRARTESSRAPLRVPR